MQKKSFVPKIATANHLLDGDVIYFADPGWSRHMRDADVATTHDAAQALLDRALVIHFLNYGSHD